HPPPDFARHQVMELGYIKSAHAGEEQDSVAFAVRQNRDGELLVGSSRQYGSNDPQVEPRMIERMLKRAIAFMPDLAGLPELRSWAGFRAGTPDGLPLIGLCPGLQRVYAATGHEGLGATTSLATARLLADAILNREPEINAAPYLPSRFAAEEL
ncbi:MAG: FAD-binding oxidoreductase, partial [Acidobacteriaceae bacterium]|nr:FAD-binding oxidoreductase [Acidobacteriaceae bacterium]